MNKYDDIIFRIRIHKKCEKHLKDSINLKDKNDILNIIKTSYDYGEITFNDVINLILMLHK